MYKRKKRGHHRKPQSIGGSNDQENLWNPPVPHIEDTWHVVFKNMCAPRIAAALQVQATLAGYVLHCTRTLKPLHSRECPKRACPDACTQVFQWNLKERNAWAALQLHIARQTGTNPSIENTIPFINAHLLDPDYTLELRKKSGR